MPLTTKKLCGDRDHQVISPVDYVRELAANNKLENLTGGEPLKSTLRAFWERFQYLRPDHPALAHGVEACACSVPILLFGDEGRALKKRAAMVLGWEPMLGFGCMTHCTDDPESHHGHKLNFDGSTYKTRMLYTIMHKKTYGSKKSGNKYLMSLVDCWASDHAEAMQGVVVQHGPETIRVHLIPVGIKCDWPALVKLGQIKRSFYCDAVPHGKGICHLCMANTAACPDYSGDGWKETMQHSEAFTAPWDAVPALVSQLCPGLDEWQQAAFYRLDLFHICHKGVMAELAGSGLVTLLDMRLYPARGSFEDRLGLVYEDLKSFAKSEKLEVATPYAIYESTWAYAIYESTWAYETRFWRRPEGRDVMVRVPEDLDEQPGNEEPLEEAYPDGEATDQEEFPLDEMAFLWDEQYASEYDVAGQYDEEGEASVQEWPEMAEPPQVAEQVAEPPQVPEVAHVPEPQEPPQETRVLVKAGHMWVLGDVAPATGDRCTQDGAPSMVPTVLRVQLEWKALARTKNRCKKGLPWITLHGEPDSAMGMMDLKKNVPLIQTALEIAPQMMNKPRQIEKEVKTMYEKMEWEVKDKQPYLDSWNIRRLVSYAQRRAKDAHRRGQTPRELWLQFHD
ncbi:unnamed protein product [Symbiodinium sp. CCMP2592]|nr:unnamed protein product [Symbiodinium sp. CCMP2592]